MSVAFMVGDVRKLLREVPDGSVDLIATSWPYLAQRSYLPAGHPMKAYEIGQESTPAEFIGTLLEVTAEFRRVLAPHGSIATELGDGFSGSGGGGGDYLPGGLREGQPAFTGSGRRASEQEARDANAAHWRRKNEWRSNEDVAPPRFRTRNPGEEWPLERSLIMAPELYRVALAYGIHPLTGEPSPAGQWRVRNVVVHGRPNPPVGALGDKIRPACSYWAVACVNRRWFDLDAVRTEHKYGNDTGFRASRGESVLPDGTVLERNSPSNPAGAPPLDWFEDDGGLDQFARDLWTLPTSPYPGSHYATFSPELIRRFIVSMCPARVCRVCGKPRERITVAKLAKNEEAIPQSEAMLGWSTCACDGGIPTTWQLTTRKTWKDCGKPAGWKIVRLNVYEVGVMAPAGHWIEVGTPGADNWRPGLTLDPFGGSGTTGMVAAGNGRDALLFDLDERCETLARERIGLYLAEQAEAKPPVEVEPEHEQEAML